MSIQNKHVSMHTSTFKKNALFNDDVEVTFYLRHFQEKEASKNIMQHPVKRQYVQGKQFQKVFATDSAGMDILKAFLEEFGIEVLKENKPEQTLSASGNVAQFDRAFKVAFSIFETPKGQEHLSYEGNLDIPANLEPYLLTIKGLDKDLIKGLRSPVKEEVTHHETSTGYSPQQISEFYNFPSNDAKGECIGLVELGGDFKMSDIKQYCKEFNLPVPEIVEMGIKPKVVASAQSVDNLEVSLDIQMVAGLAQNAKIVIYYASSIPEAIHLAIHDTKHNPSVLSCSWAISESDVSIAEKEQLNQLCYQAALQGMTIIAASGDHGAYNSKSYPNVMLPASNPFVLGCGGTGLYISKNYEQVWDYPKGYGSGGGYSTIYPIPAYQQNTVQQYKSHIYAYGNAGRGVPDVAANSSPTTGYTIVINGKMSGMGAGTSASTPVWASLILTLNKNLGYRLGWVNSLFYKLEATSAFKQIRNGNNGVFPAAYGWNPATGLGAPDGVEIKKGIEDLELYYAFAMNESMVKEPVEKTVEKPKDTAEGKTTNKPVKKNSQENLSKSKKK